MTGFSADIVRAKGYKHTMTYDWDYWRYKYVSGDDSLESLALHPTAPQIDTLKKRSSKESWPEQRSEFRIKKRHCSAI